MWNMAVSLKARQAASRADAHFVYEYRGYLPGCFIPSLRMQPKVESFVEFAFWR